MGSFNTTCAVSKTPILEGQEARVFFLVMNGYPANIESTDKGLFHNIYQGVGCYPWTNFSVIGYPLLGTYADYNRYEFDDEEMSNLTLQVINKVYAPNRIKEGKTEEDYNSYHDYLNIEKINDMEQLQDMEHSGALRIKTFGGTTLVCKMAIHEEIYQKMILSGKKSGVKDYMDKTLYDFNEYVNYYLEKYKNSIDTYEMDEFEIDIYNKRKSDLNEKIGSKDSKGNIIDENYVSRRLSMFKEVLCMKSQRDLFKTEGERWHSETLVVDDLEKNEFHNNIIEAWAGGMWTKDWFLLHNLEFAPVITSGQEYDFKSDANHLCEIAGIVRGLKSRWEDDESFAIETETTIKKYLSIKDIESKCEDWFGSDKSIMKKFYEVMKDLRTNRPENFTVGDDSLFNKFSQENYLINESQGTVLYFKYN